MVAQCLKGEFVRHWPLIAVNEIIGLLCLSVSLERVPVRSTLLNIKNAAHGQENKCPESYAESYAAAALFCHFRSFPCDQCVPITQSDTGGVWHVRVVMDRIIFLHNVVLLAICDMLASTRLYRFVQYKVV